MIRLRLCRTVVAVGSAGACLSWCRRLWYVLRGSHASGVLKVQHRVVGEIGIANRLLAATQTDQRQLLSSFPNTSASPV